ncbi:GatB family leaderless bacteriocin [Staphylococcus aureus]|nr:GatB family leaderless bacteriocin [Staphylococcus aureus]UXT71732.1 GatB family leaderless bacteriocin [Staphylococcus aureus]UXT95747.1 GatB family leaderless bacteriocin [Staphylococcus aureus]UXU14048.1 GatB family leaderless bacteriocin [Staphylococcus aureus]HEA0001851.1 GatB family leaderless bacteriocin [Staphylococcus aureus]HEA0068157.1 GatB family leaderless bacteriocin [Staphylococcus aureus]
MGAVIKVGAKVIDWGAASGAGLYGLEKNLKKYLSIRV